MEVNNLILQSEPSSARTFNKHSRNVYEQLESCYYLINNLYDTLGGNLSTSNSTECYILPGILEEFNKNNLIKSGNYIRIPTGAFYCKKFSNVTSSGYTVTTNNDKQNSTIVVNRPNIEEFEREIAEYCYFDLHDRNNDLLVDYKISDNKIYYNYTVNYYSLDTDGNAIENSVASQYNSNDIFDLYNYISQSFGSASGTSNDFYDNQTLEEVINIKNLDSTMSVTYYLYYLTNSNYNSSVDTGAKFSVSGKYAISSDSNLDTTYGLVKIFSFTIGSDALYSIKNCLTSSPTRLFSCNDNDVKNMLYS